MNPGFQLEFFTMTPVAAPVALISVFYMVLVAPCLLPDRSGETPRIEEGTRLRDMAKGGPLGLL